MGMEQYEECPRRPAEHMPLGLPFAARESSIVCIVVVERVLGVVLPKVLPWSPCRQDVGSQDWVRLGRIVCRVGRKATQARRLGKLQRFACGMRSGGMGARRAQSGGFNASRDKGCLSRGWRELLPRGQVGWTWHASVGVIATCVNRKGLAMNAMPAEWGGGECTLCVVVEIRGWSPPGRNKLRSSGVDNHR